MNLWERDWIINSDPDDVFQEAGNKTFGIRKNGVNGSATFDVLFEGNDMPAEWNDCSLVARGTIPFKLEGNPLPKFDGSKDISDKYNEAIKIALSRVNSSTRRLEGELDNGLDRKSVYLFLARDAIAFQEDSGNFVLQDLLVLKRTNLLPWSPRTGVSPETGTGVPIDDGTAHGNPR